MCNIAGYIGTKPAAPVLIEMMRRQEGYNGGCYTGIATIHDGSIRYEKLTGDVDWLLENTDAAGLPGNIGLIHSRTPSGGDDEWAHPFVGGKSGKIETAYVANGNAGHFADRIAGVSQTAMELESEGYQFRSASPVVVGRYPKIQNGGSVHMSDVMAQLITKEIHCGKGSAEAMEAAFCHIPAEIVGLLISLQEDDSIAWSRINMPMFVSFAPHGAYLASTPQAFPDDAGSARLLPACSGGRVFADHYTVHPYECPPAGVAEITPGLIRRAYDVLEKALREEYRTFSELAQMVKPLFETADCKPSGALVYWLLSEFEREGRLKVKKSRKEGSAAGRTAPVFEVMLAE